jgi:hypothetical protein
VISWFQAFAFPNAARTATPRLVWGNCALYNDAEDEVMEYCGECEKEVAAAWTAAVGRYKLTPPDPYGLVTERRLVSTLAPIK